MSSFFVSVIRFYQRTLSPDHSWLRARFPHGYCQFYPSCSQYAVDALQQHPLPYSLRLIASRLLRCHPWSKGGIDRVRSREEVRRTKIAPYPVDGPVVQNSFSRSTSNGVDRVPTEL